MDAEKEVESINLNITKILEKLVKLQYIDNKHKERIAKLDELEMIDSNGELK